MMKADKKNIVVLLISVSILLSMSSCNYKGRASGVWESSDSVAAEECMRKEPKIIAKYGKTFELKNLYGGGSESIGGGYVEGTAGYSFQINGEDIYIIFLKKEKKTNWYKTGIVQSSAKYSCNEMPLYFIDNIDDKPNGKMMLNGKMQDVIVGMYDGELRIGRKIYKKNLKVIEEDDDIEEIVSLKCIYDVDRFKVKLSGKDKRILGVSCDTLTFNMLEEDTGEKTAERYITNNPKLNIKYGDVYEVKRIKCSYAGAVENGRMLERRTWTYKVNGKDEYEIYAFKKEGGSWTIVGGVCLDSKYVSDDGKVWFNKLNEYKPNGEITDKKNIKHRIEVKTYEDTLFLNGGAFKDSAELSFYFSDSKKAVNTFHCDCKYDLDELTATMEKDDEKYFGEYFKTIHFHEVTE